MLGVNDIARFLQPIRVKLRTLVGRAVPMSVDNSGKSQRYQLKFNGNELIDGVERVQEYGLETNQPLDPSAETVTLSVGGNRELTIIIATQTREHRPTGLEPGEVQLYTKFGQKIYLKADGSIVIDAGSNAVNINGGAITLKGSSVDLKDAGGQPVMLETIISKFNAHTHLYSPGPGGPTPTAAPATLWVAGTDSAASVKAKP